MDCEEISPGYDIELRISKVLTVRAERAALSTVLDSSSRCEDLGRANAALRASLRYEKKKVKELTNKIDQLQTEKDICFEAHVIKVRVLNNMIRKLQGLEE
jgi:uncharacterized protein YlxW (UPF0749 family)